MSKTLIIVESPTKAKKIQEYLGNDYIVKACYGHILELGKGGKHGIGVDINNNFKPHYILMEKQISILDELMQITKQCDKVLLASDPDREGDAISYHLYQRLQDFDKPMKRITFNKINKPALLKAIKDAHDIDMNSVHSQEARRILDRLVGFMASPFLQNYFGSGLSAGRVQSVITRMIIDREREISAFKPEEFWTINTTLTKDKVSGFEMKYSGRPTNKTDAENVRLKLAAKGAQFIVSNVISEEEYKNPQPPLITSSLQRIMSKDYGMSADKTMKAAQGLYETGNITYLRTDSTRIEPEAIESVREWLLTNKHKTPAKPNLFKNKDAAQDAHECIRPADINILPEDNFAIIDPDEKLVYEVIWKYFVASQMTPAIYDTLKLTAHLTNDKSAEVKASGKALKDKGYLEILKVKDDSKIEIPYLSKGDTLEHFGKYPVKMEKKQTQPPPRYSEDKLIKELETRSIGRPATFADLLSKVATRNYVEKKGSVYHATELGKKITDELIQFFSFMDYNYTSKLEAQLDEIGSGKITHLDLLNKFYPAFKEELSKAYLKHGGTLCDKCGLPMVIKMAKATNEKFISCSGYPHCKSSKSLTENIKKTA